MRKDSKSSFRSTWIPRRAGSARSYPDSLFVSSNGAVVIPESSPGYCLDHPGVRKADLAFYAALAAHVRGNPAFAGWDLWSEPHVINWATPDLHPQPRILFLQEHARQIPRAGCARNTARSTGSTPHGTGSIDDWDEVEPGRMSTILSYTDYIDWKTFIADKLGEDLHDRYLAVKGAAPQTIVTSHAAGVGLFASPNHWEGQSDDWTMARQVDYYGTSFYPKHSSFVDRDVPWRGALLDFTRSLRLCRRPRRLLCRRTAGRLRDHRAQREPHGDARRSARLDLERRSRAAPRASTTTPGIR